MADADPAQSSTAGKAGAGEMILRVISALVLAPLAIAIAYMGGWAFVVFWGAAALGVLWEWTTLVAKKDRRSIMMVGAAAIILAVALAGAIGNPIDGLHDTRLLAAVTVLAMGMLAVAALAPRSQRFWVAGAIPYAGVLGIAPIVLRSDIEHGFAATVFLYGCVWATDILAYVVGRTVGGPKLMPKVSPKKTWSGSIGGLAAAAVVAVMVAHYWGQASGGALVAVAIVLSVAAQAGDLFESSLKRRFGAKDSGHLIPGHGGLMDRLDGFVVAAGLAAVIGLCRGGMGAPGRGLLVW